MKKYLSIYLYGLIVILAGIFLLLSRNIPFQFMKLVLGIGLVIGSVFAFTAAFSRPRKQVQLAYHGMHALAMLSYGVAIMLFCNSFEKLMLFTTFLFIFYAFSEIIFCNWLFNLAQKVVFKIIIIRIVIGLITGIGTILSMNDTEFRLQIFGILFMMVGINIILYVPVMKGSETVEPLKELQT